MNYIVVTLPSLFVVGSELVTTFKDNACMKDIPAFWQRQLSNNLFDNIPNKVDSNVVIALYANYSKDFGLTSGHYSMILGTQVKNFDNVPKGLESVVLPESKYALFKTYGQENVGALWMQIWNTKLERTFTGDFEWYDMRTNEIKIYVAIK